MAPTFSVGLDEAVHTRRRNVSRETLHNVDHFVFTQQIDPDIYQSFLARFPWTNPCRCSDTLSGTYQVGVNTRDRFHPALPCRCAYDGLYHWLLLVFMKINIANGEANGDHIDAKLTFLAIGY